jgi:hypothetical protein
MTSKGEMEEIFRRFSRMRKIASLFGFDKVWNVSIKKSL